VEPSASLRSASGSPCHVPSFCGTIGFASLSLRFPLSRSVVLWNHRLRFAQPQVPPVTFRRSVGLFWCLETFHSNSLFMFTILIIVYLFFCLSLGSFIGLYIWNCLFRKSTLPPCQTSSEDHIYSIYSSKCSICSSVRAGSVDLMGHHCHQGSVAPPAPQLLGKFHCSLWESHSNTAL